MKDNLLEDQKESQSLDAQESEEGIFTWLIKILNQTEEETYADAGHEVLLYLAFLKYSAILYLTMFVVGGIPLLILYISESHNPNQQYNLDSFMERITIKSYQGVQKESNGVWLIFVIYVLFVTMGHMQIYFFREKCKEINQKYVHNEDDSKKLKLKQIIRKMI